MVVWIIGLSGAGKTTVATAVYEKFKKKHSNAVLLDGDALRLIWQDNLGHTLEARKKNSDRIQALCKFLDDQGIHVFCSILSIFPEAQDWNRVHFSKYYEVFLDVDFDELVRRDSKGLYKKALDGELKDVVGVDIPFVPPKKSNLVLKNNTSEFIEKNVQTILKSIESM